MRRSVDQPADKAGSCSRELVQGLSPYEFTRITGPEQEHQSERAEDQRSNDHRGHSRVDPGIDDGSQQCCPAERYGAQHR